MQKYYQNEGNDGEEERGHHVSDGDGCLLDQLDGNLDSSPEEDQQDQDDHQKYPGRDQEYKPNK